MNSFGGELALACLAGGHDESSKKLKAKKVHFTKAGLPSKWSETFLKSHL
jgi:hypothetical protein